MGVAGWRHNLERDPVPTVQKAGWAPGLVWAGRNISPSLGFYARPVQPVASIYTEWATFFIFVLLLS
jgi:hypothetical protein